MVRELVDSPLEQRVLDPACGSGTFVAEAISNYLEAARDSSVHPSEVFGKLRDSVTGIDIHPVAVHLARAAYVLVARTAIQDAGYTSVTVPIYLGDALQLRYRAGDMFAEHEVTIQVNDELVFPVGLVERPDTFDAFIGDVAEHIASGDDPETALRDHRITGADRELLGSTIAEIQRLHQEGRDHIWAYYTRNMVRPVALARSKVDVVIGNPPWINYNQTVDVLRTELERQSKNTYGIWAGGAVLQVAQGRVAFEAGSANAVGGLRVQGRMGPGAAGAEQLLSRAGVRGVRREPGACGQGAAAGGRGGALVRQGRFRRRGAWDGGHHGHRRQGGFGLRGTLTPGRYHRATRAILRQRDR